MLRMVQCRHVIESPYGISDLASRYPSQQWLPRCPPVGDAIVNELVLGHSVSQGIPMPHVGLVQAMTQMQISLYMQ